MTDSVPYAHKVAGRYFAQIQLSDGTWCSAPLDTGDPEIARSQMVALVERLIIERKIGRSAKVARTYRSAGRCPHCGQVLPGGIENRSPDRKQ